MATADWIGLRDALVDHLVRAGVIDGVAVQRAFRAVPRHVFLPGVEPPVAYADEAVVTDRDAEGRPISSSSQPSIMAVMLEQLGVQPGNRVLEVGAGTGYNAALLAELVGPTGSVVTIDIDVDVVRRARRNLDQAGCARVRAVHADGAHGWPAGAPFDRIILTVGAWDIAPAWVHQLADGGRLLLPLSLRGAQRSVAFEQIDDALASVSIADCGFMPMRGELAGPASATALGPPGIFLHLDDDRPLDTAAITAALRSPGAPVPTGIRVTATEIMGGLHLWLVLHEPDAARLEALGTAAESGVVPALVSYPGMSSTIVLVAERGLAALARRDDEPRQPDGSFELDVRGYGPGGDSLADRLAGHVGDWAQHGRPSTAQLRIRAYPRGTAPPGTRGSIVVHKPQARLVLHWS